MAVQSMVMAQTITGTVCKSDGQPLAAAVAVFPLSYRFPVTEALAVNQGGPDFNLDVPMPGIYFLQVKEQGFDTLEIPFGLDKKAIQDLKIYLQPAGGSSASGTVCSDQKLKKWSAIHQDQKNRYSRWDQGQKSVDWKDDLRKLSRAIDNEPDLPTRAYLAACYMDLGPLGADLDSKRMPHVPEILPGDSPFWGINPRSSLDVINNLDSLAAQQFLDLMEHKNPNPEVRAFALYARIITAASEYAVEDWLQLYNTLITRYPQTRSATAAKKNYDPSKVFRNGMFFPEFEIIGLDGRRITQNSFQGKVWLVDFWGTWCPPCIKEMPKLQAVYEKFHQQGFEILSLAIDDKAENLAKFRQKYPMPWFHAIPSGGRSHPLPYALFVDSIPRAFLVGPDGRILECKRSLLRGERLVESVEKFMTAGGRKEKFL